MEDTIGLKLNNLKNHMKKENCLIKTQKMLKIHETIIYLAKKNITFATTCSS